MESDREHWDARHGASGPAAPAPPAVLATRPDLLALVPTSGRAIDVACGRGAVTLWLAERGTSVLAVDISPVALEHLRRSATDRGVADRVETRRHDLDTGLPADATDVDVVVCQRFRDPALYGQLVDALAPGGLAVVTVLSAAGPGARSGPHHAPPGELAAAFERPDVEIVVAVEGDGLSSVVFRRRPPVETGVRSPPRA